MPPYIVKLSARYVNLSLVADARAFVDARDNAQVVSLRYHGEPSFEVRGEDAATLIRHLDGHGLQAEWQYEKIEHAAKKHYLRATT